MIESTTMDFELVFKTLLEKFAQQKINHALIGGFALHTAGYQRATNDIDFLIAKEDASKAKQILLALGYEETNENEQFANFWHPMKPFGNVDFLFARSKYTENMLKRAVEQKFLNGQFKIKVVIPEDIIGLKIQASAHEKRRQQDIADIQAILENNKSLDVNLIREYANLFNRTQEIEEMLKRAEHA